jgi:prepilin signal peptidase PulO-like enzyme (type II secretory pathway)
MLLAWVVVMIPQLFFNTEAAITRLLGGVLGFALCGVLLLLVYLISRRGLGGADVKFMAAAGLYLGWSYSLAVLLIGSVLAALVCGVLILLKKLGSRDSVPLIPFLFVGILFSLYSR